MGQAMKQIFDGMEIYDWEGANIGKITRYDLNLGYLETSGAFTGRRYIPISAVESIGPGGAYLNVPASTVKELYQHMPKVTPNLDVSGKLAGGKVASGYTGRLVPLDAEGVRLAQEKIKNGAKVFDADGRKLGAVQAYDRDTGYMRVEKGEIFKQDLFLPVTAVAYLDDTGIHLSEPKDNIVSHFVKVPEVAMAFFAQ